MAAVRWVFNDLPDLPARCRRGALAGLRQVAAIAERNIKSETPVDTGRLRDSNRVSVDAGSLAVRVVNDAPYALFVEFGTSKMAPRLFMTRGMQRTEALYARTLAQVVERALAGGR